MEENILLAMLKKECGNIDSMYQTLPRELDMSALEHFNKLIVDDQGTTLGSFCEIMSPSSNPSELRMQKERLIKVLGYIRLSFKYRLRIASKTALDFGLWLYKCGDTLRFSVSPKGFVELYDREFIRIHKGFVTKKEDELGAYTYDRATRTLIRDIGVKVKSSDCELNKVEDIAFVFITLEDLRHKTESTYIATPKFCYERSFSTTNAKYENLFTGRRFGSWDIQKPLVFIAMCHKSLMIDTAKMLPNIFKEDLSTAEMDSNKDLYRPVVSSFDKMVKANGGNNV